jgi:hypothetical protein
LLVDSDPPGADIRIDGRTLGQTPWAAENGYARGAKVTVTLSRHGFRTWTASFVGGEPVTLHAKLERSR